MGKASGKVPKYLILSKEHTILLVHFNSNPRFYHTPKIPEISGSYLLALGKDGVGGGGYPEVIPGFCKIDQKNGDFRKSGSAQGFKKRAAKPPRNRSET